MQKEFSNVDIKPRGVHPFVQKLVTHSVRWW